MSSIARDFCWLASRVKAEVIFSVVLEVTGRRAALHNQPTHPFHPESVSRSARGNQPAAIAVPAPAPDASPRYSPMLISLVLAGSGLAQCMLAHRPGEAGLAATSASASGHWWRVRRSGMRLHSVPTQPACPFQHRQFIGRDDSRGRLFRQFAHGIDCWRQQWYANDRARHFGGHPSGRHSQLGNCGCGDCAGVPVLCLLPLCHRYDRPHRPPRQRAKSSLVGVVSRSLPITADRPVGPYPRRVRDG